MTEPLYTYIKGQGWVLRPPFETRLVKCKTQTARLEARMPGIGEVHLAVWHPDWVLSPGVPNLKTVGEALQGYTKLSTAFQKYTDTVLGKMTADAFRYNTIPAWVTIIPLD